MVLLPKVGRPEDPADLLPLEGHADLPEHLAAPVHGRAALGSHSVPGPSSNNLANASGETPMFKLEAMIE